MKKLKFAILVKRGREGGLEKRLLQTENRQDTFIITTSNKAKEVTL